VARDPRPLVAHVVFRFDTGGLENGVVNLINHLPVDRFRHAVIALTEVTDFRRRVQVPDVRFESLHKGPGHGVRLYPRLWRLFRDLRPDIVHTRNLAALEAVVPAAAAGVAVRIHGEHGRDVEDLDGTSRKYQRLRRLYRPWVTRYVALSKELERYLVERVHVDAGRIAQIYNGVDSGRFAPAGDAPAGIAGCPFSASQGHWLVGTVGRLQGVKNQTLLARAFVDMLRRRPALRERARLVIVGEGILREPVQQALAEGGALELAWLPGERGDVPDVMRGLNCFALPSLAEGISNTILEAMSSGLPVVATDVGGNAELVTHERSGLIVPGDDVQALSSAIGRLALDVETGKRMGCEGRQDVERRFSLQAMVAAYGGLYERHLLRQ
jgi:sugar transferase (PEP-CTERM/EpsH1 system associated)